MHAGCSSARLERLVWGQEAGGSNPPTPTTQLDQERGTDGDDKHAAHTRIGVGVGMPAALGFRHNARRIKVLADDKPAGMPDEEPPAVRQMPLGIVIARILVVSGMGFAAAFAIFFLVGGLWLLGLVSIAATVAFLILMFAIERGAEGKAE